jgi:hypothetical protein
MFATPRTKWHPRDRVIDVFPPKEMLGWSIATITSGVTLDNHMKRVQTLGKHFPRSGADPT